MAEQTDLILQYRSARHNRTEQLAVMRAGTQLINIFFAKGLTAPGTVDPTRNQIHFIFAHSAPAFLAYRFFQQLLTPFDIAGGIGTSLEAAQEALNDTVKSEQLLVLFNSELVEDALVNTVLRTWGRVKCAQTITQQAMSFAYEAHVPLYLPYAMQPIAWPKRDLNKIQTLKQHTLAAEDEAVELAFFDFEQMTTSKWLPLAEQWDETQLYIPDLMVKGYASTLSRMMGTTRQNIDYHLHHGDIGWERTLAATIVWQLTREEQVRTDDTEE
ncbi:MAG: hypothetical protein MR008_01365 [Aerococcus sp.]|nr:hypothetical protein [Aerococcus sp.]